MYRNAKSLSLGLLLLSSIFFFAGGPGELPARSMQSAWDLGHVVFFCVATAVWIRWRGSATDGLPLRNWALVLFAVTLLGIGIEGVQAQLGRSASLGDLFRNTVGAAVALAFFGNGGNAGRTWLRNCVRGVILVLLLAAMTPLMMAVTDEVLASRSFPILADFETPFQLSRWESDVALSIEKDTVRQGHGALRVPLSTATYSKASLQFFPGDWSGVSTLHASVFNPGPDQMQLHVRVHDEWHEENGQLYTDRFNSLFQLATGWNDLSIAISEIRSGPRERILNMGRIEGLSFFSVDLAEPRTIFIDQVELR